MPCNWQTCTVVLTLAAGPPVGNVLCSCRRHTGPGGGHQALLFYEPTLVPSSQGTGACGQALQAYDAFQPVPDVPNFVDELTAQHLERTEHQLRCLQTCLCATSPLLKLAPHSNKALC